MATLYTLLSTSINLKKLLIKKCFLNEDEKIYPLTNKFVIQNWLIE